MDSNQFNKSMQTIKNYVDSKSIIFEDVLDGEIFKASTACQAISLSPNELTIADMQPQTIVANLSPNDCTDEVVWSVEPSGIATVVNGVVTPITKGNCIVTATCGSKSAICNVTVKEYVLCTGVTLSADTLSFNTSDTQTLTATIQPSNCMQEVIWNIEPAGIVRVENNVVTPLSNGDCTITVTCGNHSDSCTVNVSCFTTMYNITNNLTKATSNNSATTIAGGTTYNATITADPDCAINSYTVTMGGVDITGTAYLDGVITIESVSGDIIITVVAVSTVVPSSTQPMKFVKNDDGTMYYEWDRAKMIELGNRSTESKKLIGTANVYTNETYSMYPITNHFIVEGVSLNDVDLWKYIPQAKVVETAQASALIDTATVLADNEFYVCNYGSSNKAQYSVRVSNASTADTSANTWLLNLIEQDTIKLPVTTEPTVQYTVNPEYLTNIIIKTHEKDSTIQYAQFANSDPNKPTDNVYSGFNTLFGVTATNANLSQAPAGMVAMSTTVVSIAFYPGTFEEFTLDNVKAYLTEHPLTFYKL